MIRSRHSFSVAAVLLAVVLGLGSVAPAQAATTKQLNVVLVTQLTNWAPSFPQTETWTGSGVGTDGQVWSFTETVVQNHWFMNGTFSMHSGPDALSGTVRKTPSYVPFVPLTYDLEQWSYTVTDGQGAYGGCSGTGSTVRRRASPLLLPPSGFVVQAVTFDLTCP